MEGKPRNMPEFYSSVNDKIAFVLIFCNKINISFDYNNNSRGGDYKILLLD
jgi:hypothetical protein